VTESVRELPSLDGLPLTEFAVGENHIPTTAFGHVVGEVGKRDPHFVVTNADGNEASGMANINKALTIRHPTADDLYSRVRPARSTSRSTRTPAPASRWGSRCSAAAACGAATNPSPSTACRSGRR